MTSKLLIPSILSIALLQACGGGGGGDGGAAPAASTSNSGSGATGTAASADSGSVSAKFVAGAASRYQLAGVSVQTFGGLSASVQSASGAMTTLGTNVLSGSSVTKDISGDATYAMGRWVAGTVTRSSGSETLSGTDNRAYHYIALNSPAQFPTTGTLSCDAGTFTTPTYQSGGSGTSPSTGSATGSATLSFGAGGASVGGAVNVAASGSAGAATLNTTITSTTSTVITGAYLGGGAGAAVQIGDAGGGAFLVAAGYAATLANGARYIGVAKFRCAA